MSDYDIMAKSLRHYAKRLRDNLNTDEIEKISNLVASEIDEITQNLEGLAERISEKKDNMSIEPHHEFIKKSMDLYIDDAKRVLTNFKDNFHLDLPKLEKEVNRTKTVRNNIIDYM